MPVVAVQPGELLGLIRTGLTESCYNGEWGDPMRASVQLPTPICSAYQYNALRLKGFS